MATDNKGVAVYLPPDLEKLVTDYCLTHGVTRKAKDNSEPKPAMGTGILAILKDYFQLNSEIPSTVPDAASPVDVTTGALLDRVTEKLEGGLLAELLKDAVDVALGDRIEKSDHLIRQMTEALAEYDTKIEDASKRTTDTAAAFIDGQIEQAIAPLIRSQAVTSDRLASLQALLEFEIVQRCQTIAPPEPNPASPPTSDVEVSLVAATSDNTPTTDATQGEVITPHQPNPVLPLEMKMPFSKEPEPVAPQPLTQSALAQRLKVGSAWFKGSKTNAAFIAKSRKQDPEGVGWIWDAQEKRFFPINEG
jgi:hypothetical protein